jgi:hypothetical protein
LHASADVNPHIVHHAHFGVRMCALCAGEYVDALELRRNQSLRMMKKHRVIPVYGRFRWFSQSICGYGFIRLASPFNRLRYFDTSQRLL